MSETDRAIADTIARQSWLASAVTSSAAIIIAFAVMYFWSRADVAKLERLILENKCTCVSHVPEQPKQIHEQHVTLQPGWGREDTIREGLKRQWDKNNDVQRMEHAKSSD